MAQKPVGLRTRTTVSAERGGVTRILRSGPVAHMKEIRNKGAGSNFVYRIKKR